MLFREPTADISSPFSACIYSINSACVYLCALKSLCVSCSLTLSFTSLEVDEAMPVYFCPTSTSYYIHLTWKGWHAQAHTNTRTHRHKAPTAFLFVFNLGGFNKSHSSFQALSLSGLLETAYALREFKPSDPHSGQLAFFFQRRMCFGRHPLLTAFSLLISLWFAPLDYFSN